MTSTTRNIPFRNICCSAKALQVFQDMLSIFSAKWETWKLIKDTCISTQTISEKENSPDHVYTYIHTYMEKRKRKRDSKSTNVIFYDGFELETLQEISFRNDTNVSSIISNLIREFNALFKTETPQKTLFNFEENTPGIDFENIENRELKQILLAKTDDEFKIFETKLQEILSITNKVYQLRG
jgi:hypothetical protein